MYLIKNVSCPISANIDLRKLIMKKIGISSEQIKKIKTLRRSIDARKRNQLRYNFTLMTEIEGKIPQSPDIAEYSSPQPYITAEVSCKNQNPFIIGAGPAGLFAALTLVEKGFQPYIFDRGEPIEKRTQTVNHFWETGELDTESNVQFGEGGAGTFSDGKLTSRSSDYYTNRVLSQLIEFGADKSIMFEALPHIGTDGLKKVVVNIRKYLEDKGCRFFWKSKFEDMEIKDNRVHHVIINDQVYKPEILILAIGNAARDTFRMLHKKLKLSAKSFAIGFRIEHRQDFINKSFYGDKTDFSITGPATYRLTAKHGGRGIFSFCLCPGGEIVGAASQIGSVVTNGMSNATRDSSLANSAIVTTVNESDFGTSTLAGLEFQEMIEQKAFNPDFPYCAPTQKAPDYLKGKTTAKALKTSYQPGCYPKDINTIFPDSINLALKTGLKHFEKMHPGFMKFGRLVAPETRTSSPLRIVRIKESFLALGISNLYPLGEGAGYAGGIISSATDGVKAMHRIRKF